MKYSWELLRADMRSERLRYPGETRSGLRESYAARATRVTVVVESRIGVFTQFHGAGEPDLEQLIDRAVAGAERNLARSPRRTSDKVTTLPVDDLPRDADLRALAWLHDTGSERTRIDCTIENSSGTKIDTCFEAAWREFSCNGHVMARAPTGTATVNDRQPQWAPERLLFAPWVLSHILLEPFMGGILGTAPLRKWPAETLVDPGWGAGVDYEGTARRQVVFTHGASLLNTPSDRVRAWTSGRESTGHAGFSGPVVRDLVVLPTKPTAHTLPSGTLVAEATCLARRDDSGSTVLGLSLLNENGTILPPVIAELDDVSDLLNAGEWRGPWQRGKGPWTSRWLVIGIPNQWLRIHHK